MNKKLGLALAMILLTTVAARSSALTSTASPAWKTTNSACPFIPGNCCGFKIVGSCPVCIKTC